MYIGNFDSFRFTPESTTNVNAVVTAGGFFGVTRANVPAGEVGLAFMAQPKNVYSFAVTALDENKDMGTAIYVDGDGDVTFSANDGASPATAYMQIGNLWTTATAGDTEIYVALK